MRTALAVALLAFQVAMIVYARFDPRRYYCWAPHDEQTEYRIRVRIDGRWLSPDEVHARYRDPWSGVNPRAAEHVIRLVRQYERTYGEDDPADVFLHYRINGGEDRIWRWPES